MDTTQAVSAAVAAATVLGGLLAYFKYKPGQREAVDMELAQAHMNVAKGTFELVTTELEDQFKRMSAEMREAREHAAAEVKTLRAEFDDYRKDTEERLSEMAVQLRAERAEKVAVKRENGDLRKRVDELEREVASLKAFGPHNP